jgi:hypothetical protein
MQAATVLLLGPSIVPVQWLVQWHSLWLQLVAVS